MGTRGGEWRSVRMQQVERRDRRQVRGKPIEQLLEPGVFGAALGIGSAALARPGWQAENLLEGGAAFGCDEQLVYRREREPAGLESSDATQATEVLVVVQAEPASKLRRWEEPPGLVGPDVAHGDAALPTEILDPPRRACIRHTMMIHQYL
jgi:hypothetical protein